MESHLPAYSASHVIDLDEALEELLLGKLVDEPIFFAGYRRFLRACLLHLLPTLPAEVTDWFAAADAFEQGTVTDTQLTEIRVQAWTFHNARSETSTRAELSGLRASLFRLHPKFDRGQWLNGLFFFREFCVEAGLPYNTWWSLLLEIFAAILAKDERYTYSLTPEMETGTIRRISRYSRSV